MEWWCYSYRQQRSCLPTSSLFRRNVIYERPHMDEIMHLTSSPELTYRRRHSNPSSVPVAWSIYWRLVTGDTKMSTHLVTKADGWYRHLASHWYRNSAFAASGRRQSSAVSRTFHPGSCFRQNHRQWTSMWSVFRRLTSIGASNSNLSRLLKYQLNHLPELPYPLLRKTSGLYHSHSRHG